jgi:hypothetical protein
VVDTSTDTSKEVAPDESDAGDAVPNMLAWGTRIPVSGALAAPAEGPAAVNPVTAAPGLPVWMIMT